MIDGKAAAQRQNRKRHFIRYREIANVLVKYRLGDFIRIFGLESFLPFHWVPPTVSWRKESHTKSQRVRMAMEELGTTFVKMGQILSTRTDVVPSDYAEELVKLQRSLTPLPIEVIEEVIQKELGRPLKEMFASFEPNPIGVASIGQAHAATLKNGTEVVVKVRKPGVIEQVTVDLEILRQVAVDATNDELDAGQYNFPNLIEEIADTMMGELDYMREGHSAQHFERLFSGDSSVHSPEVFWEYTTYKVITLERIRGIGILDYPSLEAAKFDRKELAKRCVNIWVKMIFEDEAFHADPHPGNVFVEPDGRIGLVDFGMTGLADDEVRDHLASAVKGILDRDVDMIVESLIDMGAIAPAASRESLRRDLKHVMGHYPISVEEMQISSNLGEMFSVVRRNHVQLPANTFLLLKTMSMAQALGRGLDPDFDFFAQLVPNVERVLKKKYSPSAILRQVPSAIGQLALFGVELPGRIIRIVRTIERGDLTIHTDVSGLDYHIHHLERVINRAVWGVIIAAVILSLAITGYLGLLLRFLLPQVRP